MAGSTNEDLVASLDVVQALVLQAADPLSLFHRVENYTDLLFDQYADHGMIEFDEEDDPAEYVRWLCGLRNPRSVDTFVHSGEFLDAVNSTHRDERLRWSALPSHERHRRWQDNFRMVEADFDELLQFCTPFMREHRPRKGHRFYSSRTQLLVTLHFLAHCHTLRSVAEKFGLPHNSISQCCIHRGVAVLRHVFMVNADKKNVNRPRSSPQLLETQNAFKSKFKLPGCVGTIDGSVIPIRKPPPRLTGGDSDCYWNYHGHCAIMLLAVVNSDMLFTYVNAGAPGNLGDAGLYSASKLSKYVNDGL
jgi:hypothetical protein